MLEITCQDSEVRIVPVDDLLVIRAIDRVAGIVVNIPLTAMALAVELPAGVIALAA